MTTEDYQTKLNGLQDKIGEDAASLIMDDIAVLLQDNKTMNEDLNKKDEEIKDLKGKNEKLQMVNGNLLQQVSLGPDPDDKKDMSSGPQIIDLRSAFDEKRKF